MTATWADVAACDLDYHVTAIHAPLDEAGLHARVTALFLNGRVARALDATIAAMMARAQGDRFLREQRAPMGRRDAVARHMHGWMLA